MTAGCGFIGSHLCKALVSRGDAVRVLDDLSTGSLANLPAAATFIQCDVADPRGVSQAMTGVDGCFHLAAVAPVELSNRDWLRTHRTDLTGAITVFDAAIAAGRVPVVYTSSAAVYGDCPSLPLRGRSEKQPLSAYGADKFGGELHARSPARCTAFVRSGFGYSMSTGPGRIQIRPIPG